MCFLININHQMEKNMPYVAYNSAIFKGKSVGTGQCVAFVEAAASTPRTGQWQQGKKVKGDTTLATGTAIATFQNGSYQNSLQGSSHAAIYLRQTAEGIYVLDQWNHQGTKQVVHERLILFRKSGWTGKSVDNGDSYCVIE